MPELPRSTPQISRDVPGVYAPYTREFGQEGNAIAGVGGDILGTSLDVINQVRHAEAQNSADDAYNQEKLDSTSHLQELQLKYSDGYIHEEPGNNDSPIVKNDDGSYRTIAHEFHDRANERYQFTQSKMPNELAAQLYRERTTPFITEQTIQAQHITQQMKVHSYDQNQEMWVKRMGDTLADNPGPITPKFGPDGKQIGASVDMTKFYDNANDQRRNRAGQIGNMYNADGASERTFKDEQQLSYYAMQGAYVQIYGQKKVGDPNVSQSIYAWLDVLHGKDPASLQQSSLGKPTISTMMDPKQKELEEKKLLSLLPGAKQMDLSNFEHQYNNTVAAEKMGKGNDSVFIKTMHDIVDLSQNDSPLHRGDAVDKFSNLMASREIGKLQGPAFAKMSPDSQTKLIENLSDGAIKDGSALASKMGLTFTENEGSLAAENLKNTLGSLKRQYDSAKDKDTAAFLQTAAPNGSPTLPSGDAMAKTINFQNMPSLGTAQNRKTIQQWLKDSQSIDPVINPGKPQNYRPITMTQSQTMGAVLTNSSINEEMTANNLKGLWAGFGSYTPHVIQQMLDDHSIPDSYAVLKNINPSQLPQATSTAIISAVRGSKYVDKLFMEDVGGNGAKEGELKASVSKFTTSWAQAQEKANPYSTAIHDYQASTIQVVSNYAKQLYHQDPSQTFDTVAQKAADQLINRFSHTVSGGSPGKLWGVNNSGQMTIPKQVGDTPVSDSDVSRMQSTLSSYLTEDGLKRLNFDRPKLPNGKKSPYDEHFTEQVIRTGSPVFTNHPSPGFMFIYKSGPDEILTPLTRNGQPLLIPFDEVYKKPPPEGFMGTLKKFIPDAHTFDRFIPKTEIKSKL